MKANVVGIQKTDFQGRDGAVKLTKYHLVLAPSKQNPEAGSTVDTLGFNEMLNGSPPPIKIGETIDVQYTKNGKLELA